MNMQLEVRRPVSAHEPFGFPGGFFVLGSFNLSF